MKKLLLTVITAIMILSCSSPKAEGKFGTAFTENNARTIDELIADTTIKDGAAVQVKGTVNAACQHGGCWISVKTKDGKEVTISTEERFTIPKNSAGHEVVASGKWVSVEAQKEQAKKEGSKDEDINAITTPTVIADGIEIR